MKLNDCIFIPDNVATRVISNEAVMLNLDTGDYFGLDPIGSRFIQLLESNCMLADVHRLMLDEYDATAETLEHDLLQLANEMYSKGLLKPQS